MRYQTKLVDSPIPRCRPQVTLPKSISHVVQIVGIFNAEIRGPSGIVLDQRDLYRSYILPSCTYFVFFRRLTVTASSRILRSTVLDLACRP